MILDDFFVQNVPDIDAEIFRLPIVKTAREVIGKEIVTNMVALGTVARVLELQGLLKPDSIKQTILENVPKGTEELNSRAFDEGYKLMKEKK